MPAAVAVRALLAGAWAANGLPHLIHGALQHTYPCKLGDGPAPNALAGVVALSVVPFMMGTGRTANTTTRWLLMGAGAVPSLMIHIRYGKAGRCAVR